MCNNNENENIYFSTSYIFADVTSCLIMLLKASICHAIIFSDKSPSLILKRLTALKHYYCPKRRKLCYLQKTSVCICVVVLVQYHASESYRAAQKLSRGTRHGFRKEDARQKGRYSACCLIGSTFDLKASHLPEEDGAEQEDGIEKQQTQAQPAIQPPVVQMNTHHLRAERKR